MNIVDISWPLSEQMTFYKDRPGFIATFTKTFEKERVREQRFVIGSHTGTHIDAPAHFLKDGATIDHLSLETFIGEAMVVDCTSVKTAILPVHLEHISDLAGKIVLFKTLNSSLNSTDRFNSDFIYLSLEAAAFLVSQKVKAVGIDYLGIERDQPGHETHKELLGAGIGLIEGLRLGHVNPGNYFFVAAPLLIAGSDGAPARALLVDGLFDKSRVK